MKTVIELELIADDSYEYLRLKRTGRIGRELSLRQEIRALQFGQKRLKPWVAKIIGTDDKYGLKREFIRPQTKDFSRANSTGSRGIYAYYTLDDGVYEINRRVSWKKADRYFVRVNDGQITEISREEVLACLKSDSSASTS